MKANFLLSLCLIFILGCSTNNSDEITGVYVLDTKGLQSSMNDFIDSDNLNEEQKKILRGNFDRWLKKLEKSEKLIVLISDTLFVSPSLIQNELELITTYTLRNDTILYEDELNRFVCITHSGMTLIANLENKLKIPFKKEHDIDYYLNTPIPEMKEYNEIIKYNELVDQYRKSIDSILTFKVIDVEYREVQDEEYLWIHYYVINRGTIDINAFYGDLIVIESTGIPLGTFEIYHNRDLPVGDSLRAGLRFDYNDTHINKRINAAKFENLVFTPIINTVLFKGGKSLDIRDIPSPLTGLN